MTSSDIDGGRTDTLTKDERELSEKATSGDEQKYPLAEYAQQILRGVDGQ